jgi:hypothetical protein
MTIESRYFSSSFFLIFFFRRFDPYKGHLFRVFWNASLLGESSETHA